MIIRRDGIHRRRGDPPDKGDDGERYWGQQYRSTGTNNHGRSREQGREGWDRMRTSWQQSAESGHQDGRQENNQCQIRHLGHHLHLGYHSWLNWNGCRQGHSCQHRMRREKNHHIRQLGTLSVKCYKQHLGRPTRDQKRHCWGTRRGRRP